MLKVLHIFGLFSLVINTFECSGVEKINDNSWSLTGAIRRNSSTGSTQNRPVAAATKPIKRNSSLQSTPKTSRQNSPSHSQRYSTSTPGSPLLVKSYRPQAIQMNSLFRSKSSTDKNNESLNSNNTYPNDSKNGQNQQSNQTQKGLLSRFIKSLTKKIKGKTLASIEEEMPVKGNVSKEKMTTASLEAQEKRKINEQEKPNKIILEKQNQTVLDILRGKQNQTLEKHRPTILGKSKKPKSGKQQQQTMPLESVEMPKKRVILSNKKAIQAFFEKADAKKEDCPGEASLRHFMNSGGKILKVDELFRPQQLKKLFHGKIGIK